jgi:hypothetical protein
MPHPITWWAANFLLTGWAAPASLWCPREKRSPVSFSLAGHYGTLCVLYQGTAQLEEQASRHAAAGTWSVRRGAGFPVPLTLWVGHYGQVAADTSRGHSHRSTPGTCMDGPHLPAPARMTEPVSASMLSISGSSNCRSSDSGTAHWSRRLFWCEPSATTKPTSGFLRLKWALAHKCFSAGGGQGASVVTSCTFRTVKYPIT